ncbi:DEAD/DEAH box helicase [Microbacterium rhizomatis]|uniref:DEAD/DEAH box helicase n=1 Tax=Microbacterium rhizomatis TaxID=1631477 RepID=A0A5J5IZW6_9MICO|nr:DEAD/DEAH box helicase [Microbacterium rhizomatis]KAA9106434.1 DEAD/DEAH box helicase [Microbacterium rhizomatis]
MPKSKKPAGGRPAKNFEPRYGEKKTSFQDRQHRPATGAPKAGSRSAGHRGFRAPEEGAAAPKARWTATQRAGRDESRSIRSSRPNDDRPARSYDSRPVRSNDSRPARSFDSRPPRTDDRPARSHDDRPARSYDDRPARSYDSRPARSYDNRPPRTDDRPARSYDSRPVRSNDSRPARSFDGRPPRSDDRSPRSYDDRPARSHDSRPARSYEDRPARSNDSRPARSYDNRPARSDDRPARSYDNRPARSGDRPARSYEDRPARSDDRPARSYEDRPARSNDSRPARSYDNRPARSDDRPARSYDNRPARSDDRPARSYDDRPARSDDRPARTSSDRPARSYDDRPRRDDRDQNRRSGASAAAAGAYAGSRSNWNDKGSKPVDHKYEQHVDVVHERLQAEAVQADEVGGTSWADLGLGQNIANTLIDLGAPAPFPIQAATIPEVLAGRDVLARGRTGSGKTIAFGAPLVERVLKAQAGKKREFARAPMALILAPTRELALQIDRTIQPIARSVGLFTTQIYGGVPQARQVGALRKGVDIIIGTPGRIEDLINQRKLDLSDVMVAVIDEADHMSELGFLEPVQRILRQTGEGSQKLLFSATLDREVAGVVDEFLVKPAVYEVAGETQETGTIEHRVLVIEHRDKAEILDRLVDRDGKTLVFARTRAYAEMLAEQFADSGIPAVALHGDLNQAKRTRNLERLTSGRVNVLVATDVAARGIHVDDIDLVIQADPPDEYKTYLHRSGRTGRAGAQGRVVTLITRQRRRKMTEMLEHAEINAPFEDARLGDDIIDELAGSLLTNAELTA